MPELDRTVVRKNPTALAAWKAAAEAFYERMLTDTHVTFDPTTTSEAVQGIGTLADAEKKLRADWEWVTGYERGLQDAANTRNQVEPVGPGFTDDPKDGWSASGTRLDGYAAGLADG